MVMTAADVVFAPAGRLTAYPVVTDTIPMGDKLERCPKLEVVSVAALLGKTIHNIHTGSSVSVLFV